MQDMDSISALLNKHLSILYQAVNTPAYWSLFLETLVSDLNSQKGLMAMENTVTHELANVQEVGFDDSYMSQYIEHYIHQDVWLDQLIEHPHDDFISSDNVYDYKSLQKTAYYNDWLKPLHIHKAAAVLIDVNADHALRICMQRDARSLSFSPEELRYLNILRPHIKQAMNLHEQFFKLKEVNRNLEHFLFQFPAAAFVLDENRKILLMNTKAETLLNTSGYFSLDAEILHAAGTDQALAFEQLVSGAINQNGDCLADPGGAMLINDGNAADPLEITVMPYSSKNYHLGNMGSTKVAMVLAKKALELNNQGLKLLLTTLHGLTNAEAQIVIMLCRGESIDTIAQRRIRSVHTIRSHVKAILKKIDVNRQSELVARILTGLGSVVS